MDLSKIVNCIRYWMQRLENYWLVEYRFCCHLHSSIFIVWRRKPAVGELFGPKMCKGWAKGSKRLSPLYNRLRSSHSKARGLHTHTHSHTSPIRQAGGIITVQAYIPATQKHWRAGLVRVSRASYRNLEDHIWPLGLKFHTPVPSSAKEILVRAKAIYQTAADAF